MAADSWWADRGVRVVALVVASGCLVLVLGVVTGGGDEPARSTTGSSTETVLGSVVEPDGLVDEPATSDTADDATTTPASLIPPVTVEREPGG